ncbi:hypothetical protein ASE06_15550 [Sphingopyxis sp. Root214]|uniref:alcohol dehydrogenase catalytic domain-containing protein n=1 Tax=unclassified Sphingopyxis TaxID=2614943 RepID=UPI0006FCDF8C|nr:MULTISPECIES: alcohol dehydrogenase catalytic domain-containing protein [unclassified Sphingopyxis]KQZ73751.1 hypothetical protein ASD73_13205 [Sphingopyxis sp. Root154]KRC07892.1 hypothetical protein ASE06_15550 [Sphingopyxis sp. Root214]
MARGLVVALQRYGYLAVRELSLPAPEQGEVAVQLYAAVISPREVGLVQQADDPAWNPLVPGVEASGIVTAIGSKVSRVRVGDVVVIGRRLVAAEPFADRRLDGDALGLDAGIGSWATDVVVDERLATPVVADLVADRNELAIMGETCARAAAAVVAAQVSAETRIGILGGGPQATAMALACRAAGSEDIIRFVARGSSASAKEINVGKIVTIEELDAEQTVDLLFDCRTRVEDLGDLSIAFGGTRIVSLSDRELISVAATDKAIATLGAWIAGGRFNLPDLIGKRYTVEQTNEAVLEVESTPGTRCALLIVEPLR